MSQSGYSGIGSYVFFGRESGGFKLGNPSADQNVPFNKMEEYTPPKGRYVQEYRRTFDRLEPKCAWTRVFEPGERALTPMVFKDPFLLLKLFTHKTKTTPWVNPGISTITGDFSEFDDDETIWIQSRLASRSGSNHLDRLLTGGKITQYKWVFQPGMLIMEEPSIKTNAFSVATNAMNCNTNFHDEAFSALGGWSDWDNTGPIRCGRSSRLVVINWNSAVITGLSLREGEMIINVPDIHEQPFNSLESTLRWLESIDFSLSLTGRILDKTLIEESEKEYKDKQRATLRIYYDTTSGQEKYIQCTNVVVDEHSIVGIPKAGDLSEGSVVFKGGDEMRISYSGKFSSLPDPGNLVYITP